MFSFFRNTTRLLVIAVILAKPSRLSKGKKLARAFERLGPTFIKLGQALSTRSDLIGDDMADDLGSLRDNLPPFSSAIARAIVEEQLGAPIDSLFARFDDTPVAAASIAQVHKAIAKDGKVVAVKIMRPNIEKAFARDLDLFYWIAEIIDRRVPSWHRLKPLEVIKTFRESVFFELDLRFEAAAATELANNIGPHELGLRIPAVDWKLTSRRVLTTEWVNGIAIHDVAALKQQGFDLDLILSKLARSLFFQVFRDGFFHADLHPGNLFVDKNGDIVAVDFGIMGRLDLNSRIYIAEILRGFITEDYRHVAEVHFTAGYVPAGKSLEMFTQACMAVAKPVIGKPLNEISVANLLGQMFKIAAEFEMETQPQLLLLQKTMVVTEGVGRMLNPNLNMWELARPLVEEWAGDQFGVAGKLKGAARHGYDIAKKLPMMMGYLENALKTLGNADGLKLHPDNITALNRGRWQRQSYWLFFNWTALIVIVITLSLLGRGMG